MHPSILIFSLPALFITRGVLAQATAEPTSAVPDVTFPDTDALVVCSDENCSGTCALTTDFGAAKDGHAPPDDLPFQSIYWYDPGSYNWLLYACVNYYTCATPNIGPNTCYNLYDNGVATDYTEFYHLVDDPV